MKLKVKKVSYSEVEVKHGFVVVIESQLKDLMVSGLSGKTPFRLFESAEAALADKRANNQRVKKLIVLELDLTRLDSNRIVVDEVLEYDGIITHQMVKRATEE